jgi:hypothetical protein
MRCAEGHSGTDAGIDHPVWQYRYCAGRHLDMDDPAISALLAVLYPHTPTIERVPTIVNFNFLPDMGRMDAALQWAGTTGSSWVATAPAEPWRY